MSPASSSFRRTTSRSAQTSTRLTSFRPWPRPQTEQNQHHGIIVRFNAQWKMHLWAAQPARPWTRRSWPRSGPGIEPFPPLLYLWMTTPEPVNKTDHTVNIDLHLELERKLSSSFPWEKAGSEHHRSWLVPGPRGSSMPSLGTGGGVSREGWEGWAAGSSLNELNAFSPHAIAVGWDRWMCMLYRTQGDKSSS